MSPVKLFHKYRGLSDFTLGSLLRTIAVLLPRLVGRQTRYKVADLPTERTIRYYMTKGLLDRPLGKKGTASIFGYRHLLQVLTIKYLQSQYLPLRKIKSMMQGRSNRELERLLPEGSAGPRKAPAGAVEHRRAGPLSPESRDDKKDAAAPETGNLSLPERLWRHHRIAPGIEMLLREDLLAPPDPDTIDEWKNKVDLILDSLGTGRSGRD